jgi:DNA-binding NarL/FixJ family response regulator
VIRVFIADDHAMLRAGLRTLIDGQPDMRVVGEAADGESAERGILKAAPDVAVMDISMPGRDGIKTITRVLKERPRLRVLIFTVHDEPDVVCAALAAGAAGYVEKRAVDTELVAAIRAVAEGRAFLQVTRPDPIQEPSGARRVDPVRGAADVALLSKRERHVLERVAAGHTNREVAEELALSIKSVEAYRARLMNKLGLKTRAELVRYTLECGLLHAPGSSK